MLTTKSENIQCAGGIQNVTKFTIYEQLSFENSDSQKNHQTKLKTRTRFMATKLFKNKKREYQKKFSQIINFKTVKNYVQNKLRIFKNKWINGQRSHVPENHQTQGSI